MVAVVSAASNRDFLMELIVIFLIGLELLAAVGLAVWGGRQQTQEVNQQLSALGKGNARCPVQTSRKLGGDGTNALQCGGKLRG